jgi:hypothetical protein
MASESSDVEDKPSETLTPSGLGQYIGYSGCPRFFRLKFFDHDIVNERNWYDNNSHSNLFSQLGFAFEEEQLATLAAEAESVIGDDDSDGDVISFDRTWDVPSKDEADDITDKWEYGVHEQLMKIIEDVADESHQLPMARLYFSKRQCVDKSASGISRDMLISSSLDQSQTAMVWSHRFSKSKPRGKKRHHIRFNRLSTVNYWII